IINSWQRVVEKVRASGDVGLSQLGFLDLAHPQGLIANTLLLAVPNEMTRDVLENHLHQHLAGALTDVFATDSNCAYSTDTNLHATTPEIPTSPQRTIRDTEYVDNVVDTSEAPPAPTEKAPTDEALIEELFSSHTNPAPSPSGG